MIDHDVRPERVVACQREKSYVLLYSVPEEGGGGGAAGNDSLVG